MGRLILILLMGGGILFSVAVLNINRSNVDMLSSSVGEYQKKEAKDFAKSGVEFAIRYLSDDTTWTGGTKQLNNGSVAISISNTASQYPNGPSANLTSARQITSTGICGGDSETIMAVIQLPTDNSANTNNPPAFMKYAVNTGSNFMMNGNINVQDDGNSQWNADVHTNSDFSMNGNNTIKGFLSYGGKANSNPSSRLTTNITPNQNPDNLPNYSKVDPISLPAFNPDTYKSQATTTYAGNETLSGNISLGSKNEPQIIYVGGDLTLNGTVSGYGVFIVKGNIILNGNVTVSALDPNGSTLGLYTMGDLNANGNVSVYAQIYTGGNANFNGNCNIHGSISSVGAANLNGNVHVYYRPASGTLTSPFWQGDNSDNNNSNSNKRPAIVSYYE